LFLGSDIDSPRSNVVGSLQQNSDDNDSGLIEVSETEEDSEFSHSDEEDIRTNGGATSEDSVDLRFVNVKYIHTLDRKVLKILLFPFIQFFTTDFHVKYFHNCISMILISLACFVMNPINTI